MSMILTPKKPRKRKRRRRVSNKLNLMFVEKVQKKTREEILEEVRLHGKAEVPVEEDL